MTSHEPKNPEEDEHGHQARTAEPEEKRRVRKEWEMKKQEQKDPRSSAIPAAHFSDSDSSADLPDILMETDPYLSDPGLFEPKGRPRARRISTDCRPKTSSNAETFQNQARESSSPTPNRNTTSHCTITRSSAIRKTAKHLVAARKPPVFIPKTSERDPTGLDLDGKRLGDDADSSRNGNSKSEPLRMAFSGKPAADSPNQSETKRKSRSGSTSTKGNQTLPKEVVAPESEPPSGLSDGMVAGIGPFLNSCARGVFHGLSQECDNFLLCCGPKVRSVIYWALGAYVLLLGFLLAAAVYLRWLDYWTPTLLQGGLRTTTDLGSQIICSAPGASRMCTLVCNWDDYSDIFPTVCLSEDTEGGPGSFDKIFRETYANFSQAMGLNCKMYSAPRKLKQHRNAIVLHLDQIRVIDSTGEVEKVDFDQLETKLETILDLMRDAPEDLFVFLNHVGIIPDTVLFQTGATKIIIEGILKNGSSTYHSSNGARRPITPQELLRDRFLEHTREWKIMVERLIKPGKSIKIRFNKLEDECLSLRGSIRTAITQMRDQKDSAMGPWSLLKRLSVHFGLITPPEIRYLLQALGEIEQLYKVIRELSNLFEDLWTNTMAINTNLDNMVGILRKGRDSLYKFEGDGQGQLVSWVEKLESSAKEIREANERTEGMPNSI